MSAQILDILLQKKKIDEKQAEKVKVSVSKNHVSIEQALLDMGLVNDVDIAAAKAEEFKIPFIDLSKVTVSEEVLNAIPGDLIKTHNAVPFEQNNLELKIAMIDPFDIPAIQAIQRALPPGKRITVHIAAASQVKQVVERRFQGAITTEVSEALEDVEQPVTEISDAVEDITESEESLQNAPVARIVNSILTYGVTTNASDIHIEPSEKDVRVRYRIHGVMSEKLKLPKSVHASVVARVKILSRMKIDEKRVPQDGRFPIKVKDRRVDLRVNTLPTVQGEKVVLRLLERTKGVPPLEGTGLRGSAFKTYIEGMRSTSGIILATGPTGCGKSRTLAGTLAKLNTVGVNIVTLEDPVEIRIKGVNQVQINPDAGLTFASGLRSILRQDPDIIMVGEIRDEETARLAVQAALTGHLVLSTVHTNSAAAALPRLVDMNIEPYLLASVLDIVVAQRLPRRICNHCREAYVAPQEVVDDINKVLGSIEQFDVVQYLLAKCKATSEDDAQSYLQCPVDKGGGQYDVYLYRGTGCEECSHTGYSGRIGIFEVLRVTEKIGRMILENKSDADIENEAVSNGMVTMLQDGYLKALEGITTIEDVLRVSKE